MHILEEWRIRDVEQKAERANGRLYELDSLRSDVASLERTIRELRSEINGLRDRCDRLEECQRDTIAQWQEANAQFGVGA